MKRRGDFGVSSPRPSGGAHGDSAHALNAAADDEVGLVAADLGGAKIDSVESRAAEAVDLHAGDALAHARHQRSDSGDVTALLTDWLNTAEDDLVDRIDREPGGS